MGIFFCFFFVIWLHNNISGLSELAHAKSDLMFFRVVVLQMHMGSPYLGSRHAFLPEASWRSLLYVCIQKKAQARLRLCAGWPEPLLVAYRIHYENTPIQIYRKFHLKELNFFQRKNSDIFHISAQNIDCGYSLEPPRWGGSNEYPHSMFWAEIRKIMYTPVNPSFTI